mmetsp:Transcript_361/g.968  ORF Transcript_361/g.968 Transcript_361/m.968 type:complete len:160 (+) Transcript_361:160-639(+)|eukprot:CAMPEP_0119124316 /NCGR_PEP_ID=MMETSP1310-20130426/3981_1 /TAXON_ID=464262 /ORGANISM="Genus nov. species nov., Strain RCC2339" /LENGTH=159 /DNA_ID=CAMNT_0007114255 /DNA_START=128 /DNA_END=607 /DNA_ORIENTATION=+
MADDEEIQNVVPLLLSTGKRGNMNLLKKLVGEYGDKLPVAGKDGLGNTTLHYACFGGYLDAVEELVKLKAPLDAQNLAGDTPLHKAVDRNHAPVVKFLLKSGASPDVQNRKGQQPINMARNADVRKALKERTHEKELESLGMAPTKDDDMMMCEDSDDD